MLRLLWGLFFLGITVLLLTGMNADTSDTELYLYVREEEAWEICLSVGLGEVADGKNVALLLELEPPKGRTVESVESGEGAEGVSLTVGSREGRICLLLDGIPKGDGKVLVRIHLLGDGEERPRLMGEGSVILYRLEEDGGITKIPIGIKNESDMPEPPEEETCTETETQEESTEIGSREPESEPTVEENTPPPLPWGCQETVPQDGLYAVRFWFRDGAPVICMGGGGVVIMTVEDQGKGEWVSVTFRDLDICRRYVFAVFTSDGVVLAVYEGGLFQGFREFM